MCMYVCVFVCVIFFDLGFRSLCDLLHLCVCVCVCMCAISIIVSLIYRSMNQGIKSGNKPFQVLKKVTM